MSTSLRLDARDEKILWEPIKDARVSDAALAARLHGSPSTTQLRDFVASDLSMDPAVASTETRIVFEHLIGTEHVKGDDRLTAVCRRLA